MVASSHLLVVSQTCMIKRVLGRVGSTWKAISTLPVGTPTMPPKHYPLDRGSTLSLCEHTARCVCVVAGVASRSPLTYLVYDVDIKATLKYRKLSCKIRVYLSGDFPRCGAEASRPAASPDNPTQNQESTEGSRASASLDSPTQGQEGTTRKQGFYNLMGARDSLELKPALPTKTSSN